MHFLTEYGLFLAKILTFLFSLFVLVILVSSLNRKESGHKGKLKVTKLNDKYTQYAYQLKEATLPKAEFKAFLKEEKKQKKDKESKPNLFVIDFEGDIRAHRTKALSEIITAILNMASPEDEVLVRLETPGGLVHAYGLAAAQLERIRDAKIPLTVAVDKVAASGGYMMACVADKLLAAPFAIIGSIGVVAQLPNFHRLMKKNHIDFEQITVGEYKRTLSMFGQNTPQGRKKFKEDMETIHELFKVFIQRNRPIVNVKKVSTGEYWPAAKALELGLVDELVTSDAYLLEKSREAHLLEVDYLGKKSLSEKVANMIQLLAKKLMSTARQEQLEEHLF